MWRPICFLLQVVSHAQLSVMLMRLGLLVEAMQETEGKEYRGAFSGGNSGGGTSSGNGTISGNVRSDFHFKFRAAFVERVRANPEKQKALPTVRAS